MGVLGRKRGALELYLSELGKTPLLTPKEEVKLAERIKRGDMEARDHMIRANLRLVVKIAYDYANLGVPILDLISEGNLGLVTAIERFDPSKGGKLSTYAAWWIKQAIKRALSSQGKAIRLPIHFVDKVSKMREATKHLQEKLKRQPTPDEVAEVLGISSYKAGLLQTARKPIWSLSAPVKGSTQLTLEDLIKDTHETPPDKKLDIKAVNEELHSILDHMEPREAELLRMRFGLDGRSPKTLEDIGQKLGITRERVRQLEYITLKEMRRILVEEARQRTPEEREAERHEALALEMLEEYFEKRRAS